RIVLVGMPVEPVPFDIATAQSRGVSLETVFRYANVYQKAIDLAATDAVDLGRFVSETFPFDNAVGAFERFLEGRPTDVKLQVTLGKPAGQEAGVRRRSRPLPRVSRGRPGTLAGPCRGRQPGSREGPASV